MMSASLLVIVGASILGWADVTVQPSRSGSAQAPWFAVIGSLDRPTERTIETLKRYDLDRTYRRDPPGAIDALERAARKAPESDVVFALAELSWIEGRRIDGRRFASRRGSSALDRYVDVVAYAHDFLFDPELAAGRQPADPRYRMACNFYNGGLDRLIHAAQTKGQIQPGDAIRLKLHGSEQVVRVDLKETTWAAEDVDELILASEFEVGGLDSRSRKYGLGVPLIGVRRTDHSGLAEDEFYPPEMAFPLTAFMRPNSRLRDAGDGEAVRECTLILYDPARTRTIGDAADAPALESDVTTPLAYMWSRSDLSKFRWTGLLRPGEKPSGAPLMLLRPYDPEKIPVVMVHGLWSSPLAWVAMLNELLRDPKISDRYQFLLYVYPSGAPLPIAASGLRDSLIRARQKFDPDGVNPKFNQMVLLGHSMGGLLSHAMVVDSGNRWWELTSEKQFSEIVGPPQVLAEVKHYTFFEPLPFVRRVVFLGTPHRGSDFARRVVGRVGSSLIAESDYYSKLLATLVKENPDAFNARTFRHLPTSIETLEPPSERNPNILSSLLAMTPAPNVEFHSIIGALRPGGVQETTDGVVPYWSSHFAPAKSERIVRSGHNVQADPAAVLEVRSILLQHLGQPPEAVTPPPR